MLQACFMEGVFEAGCDEAGRGCLAGPVVAAAVILSDSFHHKLLNDSKLLSEKQRFELEPYIIENALSIGVGIVDEREIEDINILNASLNNLFYFLVIISSRDTISHSKSKTML